MACHQFKNPGTRPLTLFEVLIELKRMRMIQHELIKKQKKRWAVLRGAYHPEMAGLVHLSVGLAR